MSVTDPSAVGLSLYIHIPWCVKKCPYCDFNSHAIRDNIFPESDYVTALLLDLDNELRHETRPIQSAFFGGGTPSLFRAESIAAILTQLTRAQVLVDGCEVTLEANPATMAVGKWRDFRAAGINRLSIGVQSFQNAQLQALGRAHDARQAQRTVEAAAQAGFEQINVDLMFGLPGQTLALAQADLTLAMALQPSHISYYQLTIEPNTYFYHHPPTLPEEGLLDAMYQAGRSQLAEQGYAQYEVSAYAQAGAQCAHNLNYWRFGDYLAVGAGAHGKKTTASDIVRYTKARHPEQYMQAMQTQNTIFSQQIIDAPVAEFMMNALRLKQGFDLALFSERTGCSVQSLAPKLRKAQALGLLQMDGTWLEPTSRGWRLLNELVLVFFD